MKIAVLQFDPRLGEVERNIQHADNLLSAYKNVTLDLLVLPEMAFTGYNFRSIDHIRPFLEPTTKGITAQWATRTAIQRNCTVIVGYPEISTEAQPDGTSSYRHFNSTVTIGPDGVVLANYRKSWLYYTDELWAEEGFPHAPGGKPFFTGNLGALGMVGHGICMDINPYQFMSPWTNYEFTNTMLQNKVPLVVVSMAWITRLAPEAIQEQPERPDMETVAYWLERFWPFVDSQPQEPIIVVLANRCGSEGEPMGMKRLDHSELIEMGDKIAYAGSSCVMRFQNGSVKLWEHHIGPRKGDVGLMGKGEEGMMVVDTGVPAGFLLQQKAG